MTPDIWFPNLGIQIETLSRIAINLFGIDIYWYGILIGLGVICGTLVSLYEAKRTGQNKDHYMDFVLYAVIFAIIGARLYYVVFSWDAYKNNIWHIFNTREGGLAIYGAIIASVITAIIYTKRKGIDFFLFADTGALGLITGQIIGRWANFINREAFGGYTNSLFAMRYIKDQVNEIPALVKEQVLTIEGIEYIQVHPTFLYESLWNLTILILLLIYRKHKKFDGEILALYFLGYGCGRVWIEALRTDQLKLFATQIPVSQMLSALIIIASLSFIIYKRTRRISNTVDKN